VNQLRTVAKKAIQTKKVYILMKRKWHDDYKRRFYRTKEEILNPYPSVHCLFCTTVFGNSNFAPGHFKNMKSQHHTHQNQSWHITYCRGQCKGHYLSHLFESHCRQLSSFENGVIKE